MGASYTPPRSLEANLAALAGKLLGFCLVGAVAWEYKMIWWQAKGRGIAVTLVQQGANLSYGGCVLVNADEDELSAS